MEYKKFLRYGITVAVLGLLVINFNVVIGWGNRIVAVTFPLLLGCVFAYILNILMVRLEKIYFPKSKKSYINKSRRGVCIFLSIAILFLVVMIVLYLVIPQVVDCFVIISKDVPETFQKMLNYLIAKSDELPAFQKQLKNLDLDWGIIINKISSGLMSGTKGFLSSATTIVSSFFGTVMNVVVGLVFSIYLLACKEDIGRKINRVMKAFMKDRVYTGTSYVLRVLDESFSNFIVGQATEAVILGTLCAVGMWILRLPYAGPIGALVGLTALIPIFGAYIGASLGAFMILTVDLKLAIVFLVYLIILQQVEGNLIYPKVVGSSIGLPGIWVLAAIMIGSGLDGVVGMLLGVPVAAACYKFLRDATGRRERMQTDSAKDYKPI